MPPPGKAETRVPVGLVLLFIGLAAVIFTGGFVFYHQQEEQIRGQVTGDLTSIAYLKANQITAWRGERLGDARVLSGNPFLVASMEEYLSSPAPEKRERILSLFQEINSSYRYRNVRLVDTRGRVAITLDTRENSLDPRLDEQVAGALAAGKPVLTDLMPGSDTASPTLYVIAPLTGPANGRSEPVGTIVLTIDPATDLYPLIQSWPVPSGSAETLLVERQGDHVLYLNTLRYRNDTALNLTVPLTRTDVPAVQAVMGTTGAFTGTDYRDVEVLSVLVPVHGSPWFMVAKVDTAEAFAPWRSRAAFIIVLVAVTLAGAGIIAGLLWQRRQKYYYRSLYAAESALREEEERGRQALRTSEQRLRSFYDSGLFGVVFWNMDGKITDANDTFLAMTGYSRDELNAGMIDWRAITPPEFRAADEKAVEELKTTGINHVPFEKEYFMKDGNRLPVLLACAMLDEQRYNGVAFVLDISDLHTVRAKLHESEARFRTLVGELPVGIAMTRRDGQGELALYFNRNFTAITGYTIGQVPSLDAWMALAFPDQVYRADRLQAAQEMYEEAARSTTSLPRVSRVTCRDGGVKLIEFRYTDLKAFGFWTLIDITEQKKAEQALREQEAFTRAVLDNLPIGIAVNSIDPEIRFEYMNDRFPATYRISRKDLADPNAFWEAVYHDPAIREKIRTQVLGDCASGDPARMHWADIPIAREGEPTTYIEARNVPVPDRNLMISMVWDVTDRKHSEEEIRSAKAFLDRVIDMSPFAMWIADSSGTVTRVNQSMCETIRLPPEAIVGAYNVLMDENFEREGVMPRVRAVFRDRVPVRFSIPWKAADAGDVDFGGAKDLFIDVSLFPIPDAQGGLASVVCQWVDITEQKQAEAQREALIRELERKNAELERFTYTVSHDLKSPLITIKGFAGLLEDDAQKCDPVQLKKDVLRITQAADTMQQLLSDVLELSRIGRVVSPPQETDFGGIAREAAEILAGPLAERGATVEIAPDLPVVNVDHNRIREAVVNLVENAIKFMGDQQQPVIRIGATSGESGPVFFVQDNGIGIEPRYLTRIFNLFEKLNPSVPGTGVGLAIVKRIIEVHGGRIWAESEGPGKGTTFRFTLPVAGDKDKPGA
ncbi:PAS domain S-box protein [Methanoregula sp. PtaB.Bin085]|uniref:PAS domain S-box protein n=1 Tax=Methanoregula sp. PtaB.Bin085 TaxID=1811680 RepID=UPI0009D45BF8|nr:PAS domain S-box protein [Methanoregula sp. PtaB.Bin085]OPX64445.1 MAG: sensory histidine kinase AtoS [Methanoregula sp. PtaB.Bin085]